jgi:hypothetical protein
VGGPVSGGTRRLWHRYLIFNAERAAMVALQAVRLWKADPGAAGAPAPESPLGDPAPALKETRAEAVSLDIPYTGI